MVRLIANGKGSFPVLFEYNILQMSIIIVQEQTHCFYNFSYIADCEFLELCSLSVRPNHGIY